MASALAWVPDSLYNSAICGMVTHYNKFRRDIKTLHENVQFDIYYKLYSKGRLCQLGIEFCELETFAKVLKVKDKRHLLHHCFQALMDHGVHVAEILADAFCQHCCVNHSATSNSEEKAVTLGFALGGFLSVAGWFYESERVFTSCLQLCKRKDNPSSWCKALECCIRLVHVRIANCQYKEAEVTLREAMGYMDKLEANDVQIQKAPLYCESSALMFAQSKYNEAFQYCQMSLKELNHLLPLQNVVDALRQAAKSCVVKRQFDKAEVLIKHAVHIARDSFGVKHPKYSDALLDYGFYLLNVDHEKQAVLVYQAALDVRQSVFGGNNLHVAVAHEDLAYSSYVHEYSSGRFKNAREHAEKAMDIITKILPNDHLLLASSKRVKALILEEIAVDSHSKDTEARLLQEAEDLHLASLRIAKSAFGENNVQTAKHYGNLGRLYQSLHRFPEAEAMHLKAIAIKENLLGAEDYEVALSIGHLASLYNYDMQLYEKAEQLYLRSIGIGKKLFGTGYSGLEYDYRGLLHLYHAQENVNKTAEYANILHEWNQIRDHNNAVEVKPLDIDHDAQTEDVLNRFFENS